MKYLLALEEYGGDMTYAVVGEAAWGWIHSPQPDWKGRSNLMENVPTSVLAEATEIDEDFDNGEGCNVTTGSCENDRAMYCLGLYKNLSKRPNQKFTNIYEGFIY